MFFLKTLPEKIFLPKKGKPQGNESDGIADLGWAQQADCASSGLGVPLKLRVKGEKTRGDLLMLEHCCARRKTES